MKGPVTKACWSGAGWPKCFVLFMLCMFAWGIGVGVVMIWVAFCSSLLTHPLSTRCPETCPITSFPSPACPCLSAHLQLIPWSVALHIYKFTFCCVHFFITCLFTCRMYCSYPYKGTYCCTQYAPLQGYILLHPVCIRLWHATGHFTDWHTCGAK